MLADFDAVLEAPVSFRSIVAVDSAEDLDRGAFLGCEEAGFPVAVECAVVRTLPGVAALSDK